MLVIDPNECIDCNLCVPECPIDAIYAEDDLPPDKTDYLTLNAELAEQWPIITTQKAPPPDADEWRDVPDKLQYLQRTWKE